MLSTIEPRAVETYGTSETSEFSIKANGKAFKVLIDGLYSDKTRAVVRELWSNAFDSHIAAGKADVPFDCHLPTRWEPHFSVRDYGVSLSHHGVMKLYTTVFESTKEDTNTQVGKLGLGSKSPFAYTDTFTVTAWLDGEKRTYSAYIGQDYIPRISLMNREPSDEAQGLEISFPVRDTDIYDFRLSAERTALGFDVVPNIIGSEQLAQTAREVVAQGDGWKLYSTSDYGLKAHAKQGCVVYPIDPNAVVGLDSDKRALLNSCIFIDFPIGDLEITASREGLGYDEQTCKNIVARLATIEQEVLTQVMAQLSDAKTFLEFCLKAAELKQSALPEPLIRAIDRAVWRGKRPKREFHFDSASARCGEVYKYSSYHMQRYRNPTKHASRNSFTVGLQNFHVYIMDPKAPVSGAQARVLYDYRTTGKSGDIVIAKVTPGTVSYARLIVALGRPDHTAFINVADLAKPPKASPIAGTKKPVMVRQFSMHDSVVKNWDQVTVDESVGGVYVSLDRSEIRHNDLDLDVHWSHVKDIVISLIKVGILDADDPIYAVPKTLSKMVDRDEDGVWINLFELANQTHVDGYDKDSCQNLEALDRVFTSAKDYNITITSVMTDWVLNDLADNILHAGPAQDFVTVIDQFHTQRKAFEVHRPYLSLARVLNKHVSGAVEYKVTYGSFAAKLKKAYPLLDTMTEQINRYTLVNDDIRKRMIDYVNLVDMPR